MGAGGVVLAAAATGAVAGALARRRQAGRPAVAVFREAFPGAEVAATDRITAALRHAGLAVDVLDAAAVADPTRLGRYEALILGDARFFPADAIPTLQAFLEPSGGATPGHLVAVGGPFLSEPQYAVAGGWGDRTRVMAAALGKAQPLRLPPPASWQPAGNTPGSDVALQESGGVWSFQIPDLNGWGNTNVAATFASGATLMAFEARGVGATRCIIVEWDERDGSRWIADVRLTGTWQPVVLSPSDFVFWPDPPVAGRGGPGDALHPANAVKLSIGVDTAHCGAVSGAQAWSLRQVGTLSAAAAPNLATPAVPRLTGLSPVPAGDADEAYVIPGQVRLELESGQRFVTGLPAIAPLSGAVSPVYRRRGLGMAAGAPPPYRFVPVVTARAESGVLRGAPGAILLHGGDGAAGAAWILLGLPPTMLRDAADYAAQYVTQSLVAVLGKAVLLAGGTPAIATPVGAGLALGATVLLPSGAAPSVRFRLGGRTVATVPTGANVTSLYGATVRTPLGPGLSAAQLSSETASPAGPGTPTVTVELLEGDRVADALSYPLRVYGATPTRRQAPVTASGGRFLAGAAPFLPVGINYWPRSTSGLDPTAYGDGWLAPGLYDPAVVEADLAAMEALGFNLVSGIQYGSTDQAPALRDFLARCDLHGIRANVFLAGGNPLAPDPPTLTALVRAAGLSEDPAVFAYDLAWEPHVGTFASRAAQLAAPWARWVNDQYGAMSRAQAAWGYVGDPAGPSDQELTRSGPWAPMVAAYRRFLDDLVTAGYGQVWRALRAMGDNHLLGARTGYGGTGQMSAVPQMPLDLQSGMLYLDFASPEGYGLGPAYQQTLPGGLTTAYGRAVGAGKPVFWAEWGLSIWGDPSGEQDTQGELYRSMWRMVAASGADGGAGWWFPGGFRVDERSDYGVFNPDGTPRPSATATSAASRTLAPARAPDTWIAVDRDRYVQGYAGILAHWGARYAALVAAGHLPGVTLPGTGTTSADCPLVAVGGGPYPGYGPLQALNAAFVRVQVGGQDIADGGSIPAPGVLAVTVGNTATATWVSGVVLTVTLPDGNSSTTPLPQAAVPPLGIVTFTNVAIPRAGGTVVLRLAAGGRAAFGPPFRVQA